ncbi:cytochrome P450 [Amycolatopsis taiwanensis]|uniref:cytochrome P450 n=1 Tax=Amycolatopsis taiwanensis TaxID=342230 RepID=UPI0004B4AF93|nr:cytochrome P450 [Amycolatopsis taiwanensis]
MSEQNVTVASAVIDPQSAEFVENPYDAYARARTATPVIRVSDGVYAVIGREEMKAVLRDHARFSSRRNLGGVFPLTAETQEVLKETLFFHTALFNMEPPRQTEFRNLVGEAFTPRNLRKLEPAVRSVAEELIRGFATDGADLLTQYAYPLPMRVICDIIGVPRADHAMVKEWNNAWMALQVLPLEPAQQLAMARTVVDYENYFRDLIAERRRDPADDLVSHLAATAQAGGPCTVEDVIVAMRVMLAAGHETATNLIGNTAAHLLTDRSRWEAIVGDESLIPAVVEEGLRFDSSVQGVPRTVMEDVTIAGVDIPAGSQLQVVLAAAGRDPAWVDDPDTFRLDRDGPPRHHGFGHGVHFCIGAPLARLEAKVAFETLVRELPGLVIKPGHQLAHLPGGFTFRGLTELPVTWSP